MLKVSKVEEVINLEDANEEGSTSAEHQGELVTVEKDDAT